jgi:uncharacterized protein (TIGR01244 family)
MSSFRDITADFAASPQISLDDVDLAAEQGFVAIICNRPDNEDSGQLSAADIGAACAQYGLKFSHIPVSGGFSQNQIEDMSRALEEAGGPVLAYCRSGTRSTNLWALSQAANGEPADSLVEVSAAGGYDLRGLLPTLRSLNAR